MSITKDKKAMSNNIHIIRFTKQELEDKARDNKKVIDELSSHKLTSFGQFRLENARERQAEIESWLAHDLEEYMIYKGKLVDVTITPL